MKTVYFIYNQFLDSKGERKMVGGIETYLENLCNICIKMNLQPIVFQNSDFNFSKKYKGIDIVGIKSKSSYSFLKKKRRLFKAVYKVIDVDNDVLIFASDYFIVKNKIKNSIAIQHGVAWDITDNKNKKNHLYNYIIRAIKSYFRIRRLSFVKKVVCVDYNFVNWIRTQQKHLKNKLVCITNFANVCNYDKKINKIPTVIFARRLVKYRGTEIFTEAIKSLYQDGYVFSTIIAGEGPEENFMKSELSTFDNVQFTKYEPNESYLIHSGCDIAVIPTIGSEGTSLSLLEAMSCGCACIASNVGGMTNIILDNFNGFLIFPNTNDLKNAIRKLLVDSKLRKQIADKGKDTIEKSFSFSNWEQKWIKLLKIYF